MRKQRNYFEKLFTFSADGIILTDLEGYITDVNKSIEDMLAELFYCLYSPQDGVYLCKYLSVLP